MNLPYYITTLICTKIAVVGLSSKHVTIIESVSVVILLTAPHASFCAIAVVLFESYIGVIMGASIDDNPGTLIVWVYGALDPVQVVVIIAVNATDLAPANNMNAPS
jgi:hypothetical protein